MASSAPRTLVDKLWDAHVVAPLEGGRDLIYIDLHLIHEVTTPQAFEGLRLAGRAVRRPERTVATLDHNISTGPRHLPLTDGLAVAMLDALRANCAAHGITLHDLDSPAQGIVHVIGPEQGLTQPGMTIVCGDSHTTTHGAFGALAFGIGTSEVEHVLATQCLVLSRPKAMRVTITGTSPAGRRRQGSGPGGDRRDHLRRRHGLHHRVCWRGRAGAVDGRADDAVQHEHRGRGALEPGGRGRHDHRLSRRTPPRAARRGLDGGRGPLARLRVRPGRGVRA